METRKILFNANGKDVKVTITGKKENIDHVVEALAIRQEIGRIEAERTDKDLELTRAFKNSFAQADEINKEEAKKYGNE